MVAMATNDASRELAAVRTPCVLIDLDRLEANTARVARKAHRLGVQLRPHVKTLKSVAAARHQTDGHFGGITVSTLAEAHGFAAAGFDDQVLAVPADPAKLPEVADLVASGVRLAILADHPVTIAACEDIAAARALGLDVLLEVDTGGGRSGLSPEGPEVVRAARTVSDSRSLRFRGLLTHAGQAYGVASAQEAAQVAATERDTLAALADRLRREGLEVPEVSVGSTPGFEAVDHLEGVTEARPGNSVVFDLSQVRIGTCRLEDVALTVLTTVISVHPDRGRAVLDAGSLALSADAGPTHLADHRGYGLVLRPDGGPDHGLRVAALSQEHGWLAGDSARLADLTPGDRLRIVPNHACLAAACHDGYHVVRARHVVDWWANCRGW